jgi:hypothetical protein
MPNPPTIEKVVPYEVLVDVFSQNNSVIAYAEERIPYAPTFFEPPVPYSDGYVVTSVELATSLQLIEFKTADIKVAAIYQLTFVNHDPVQILWYFVAGGTAYLLQPNIPN